VETVEQSTITAEQKACEKHFLINTTQQPDGRFVVKLPTKMEPTQLGTSRLSAEHRLHAIERKLRRGPKLKVQDCNFMKKHEEISQKKSVKFRQRTEIYYFRPHHPVSKETMSTLRTRFVSGGSDKPSISNQETPQRVQNERC